MLGVDLFLLWRAGRVELPGYANVYRRAAGALDEVDHDDVSWCALSSELLSVLERAAHQIDDAAERVCSAVAEYARTDDTARGEFERLRRDSGRGPL